jgi:hypothetical protein
METEVQAPQSPIDCWAKPSSSPDLFHLEKYKNNFSEATFPSYSGKKHRLDYTSFPRNLRISTILGSFINDFISTLFLNLLLELIIIVLQGNKAL